MMFDLAAENQPAAARVHPGYKVRRCSLMVDGGTKAYIQSRYRVMLQIVCGTIAYIQPRYRVWSVDPWFRYNCTHPGYKVSRCSLLVVQLHTLQSRYGVMLQIVCGIIAYSHALHCTLCGLFRVDVPHTAL